MEEPRLEFKLHSQIALQRLHSRVANHFGPESRSKHATVWPLGSQKQLQVSTPCSTMSLLLLSFGGIILHFQTVLVDAEESWCDNS